MIDKITTVPKSELGARIGRLGDEDLVRFNRAAIVFPGLAAPARSRRKASPGRAAPAK